MSKTSISKNKILSTLDWFLFLIFCIVAFVFCWPMVKSYDSKKTSFSQHTEKIIERPSITICFQARTDKEGTQLFTSLKADFCQDINSQRFLKLVDVLIEHLLEGSSPFYS